MTRATSELPRARVYVATTEGAVLVQRIVAEDALAEGEPSAVCLNGTTTRLPITGAYTYFIRDHVRGIAGRAAFRLDLDRRIDGGSSWMLGVWIAHLLLAQGRLAMQDEAAETAVFATGEVAFGASAERRTEVRAVGHIAEKVARLAERAAAEAVAGRRVLLFVPVANLPEAQDAFTRLCAAVREKVAFCPVDCISDARARLEAEAGAALPVRDSTSRGPAARDPMVHAADRKPGSGPRTTNADARDGPAGVPGRPGSGWRRWMAAALVLCLAAAAAGGYSAWRSAQREWFDLWREGRYLDLAATLDTFPASIAAGYFREKLGAGAPGAGPPAVTVLARRPADGGSCAGLRFRDQATVTGPVAAAGTLYRLDRLRTLCGFVVRASAAPDPEDRGAASGGGHLWILLRRETAAGARDALLPPRRLVSGSPDRGPVRLSQDLPLYLHESWTWILLVVHAPGPSPDIDRALVDDGGGAAVLEGLGGLGVSVVRYRIGLGR